VPVPAVPAAPWPPSTRARLKGDGFCCTGCCAGAATTAAAAAAPVAAAADVSAVATDAGSVFTGCCVCDLSCSRGCSAAGAGASRFRFGARPPPLSRATPPPAASNASLLTKVCGDSTSCPHSPLPDPSSLYRPARSFIAESCRAAPSPTTVRVGPPPLAFPLPPAPAVAPPICCLSTTAAARSLHRLISICRLVAVRCLCAECSFTKLPGSGVMDGSSAFTKVWRSGSAGRNPTTSRYSRPPDLSGAGKSDRRGRLPPSGGRVLGRIFAELSGPPGSRFAGKRGTGVWTSCRSSAHDACPPSPPACNASMTSIRLLSVRPPSSAWPCAALPTSPISATHTRARAPHSIEPGGNKAGGTERSEQRTCRKKVREPVNRRLRDGTKRGVLALSTQPHDPAVRHWVRDQEARGRGVGVAPA
jgi:hypothetical protein